MINNPQFIAYFLLGFVVGIVFFLILGIIIANESAKNERESMKMYLSSMKKDDSDENILTRNKDNK